ncbi:glycosyl hydrolase catalytic core-domain-containing protein [Rhizoctonia solani]|nr:glycosyl hydrolase catalytic core-domain-containing protein [Rhizoctonia solani]
MAVMSRLLPLFAYSTFALFLVVLLATPTNALGHEPRAHVARGHDSIAKRKRNPTSSLVAATTSPTSSLAPATTAQATTTPATTAPATTQAAPSTTPEPTPEPVTTKAATSSTHSSSSAAAVTTSVSVSTGGGSSSTGLDPNKKLLLAWPNGPTDLDKFQYGTRVGGMYTWSPWCPENAKILCFQQLWGTKQKSSFTSLINPSKSKMVFGFNEPNQGDQSNMSAQDGAALWNESIRPLKDQGALLVSPATTSAPSGKTWIQDMEKACGGSCGFDFIALHWYGTSIDSFKTYVVCCLFYVDDWYKTFGKPLIISEYACQDFSGGAQCTKDQTNTFHYTMGAWFDQHPGVAMYAPFGFMHDMNNVNYDNQLMSSDGSPNALGNWYLYHE